jgi:RNA polymerase sigma-70 factor (ECF subfamily)
MEHDIDELVLRAKEGDHDAFAGLYDQFASLVRAVAYDATGRLPEAEDLCQEIFLHAYRNLRQLRDDAKFPGWLMMIARRKCVSWSRSQKRRPKVDLAVLEMPAAVHDPNDDEIQQMLEAIRQLPDKERMALHQFYLAEQPAELARQTLGVSSAGFYKMLDRAKRRVAAILQKGKVKS